MIPAQIFQLSAKLVGGGRGTLGAGRREALLRSLWLHLMSPPFTASHLLSGSHTNTVMRDQLSDLEKGLMTFECERGSILNVSTCDLACATSQCVGGVFWVPIA